jgi:hypothetical protein
MSSPLSTPAVHAERDAYVAGRDQNFYGVEGPPFAIEIHARRPEPDLARLVALREQPSKLLNARRRVIRFAGRGEELAEIQSWRDGSSSHAAWLIHASGGRARPGWP